MNNFFVEFFVDFFFLKILEKKGRKFKTLNLMFLFFLFTPKRVFERKKDCIRVQKLLHTFSTTFYSSCCDY